MNKYRAEAAIPAELERSTPARAASVVADVLVPVAQAGITGAVVAGLAVLIAWQARYKGDMLMLWATLALAIAAVVWVLLLFDTRRLLWAVERLVGRDLDHDGAAGKPSERIVIVNAAGSHEKQAQRAGAQRRSEFAEFVADLETHSTAARVWEPRLGRAKYSEFRDVLIRCGWARWRSMGRDGKPNETKGWELTTPAAEILERIAG